jgi:hypothetical protein
VSYPVSFEAGYAEERSRLSTFFRLILAIPLFIWAALVGVVAWVAVVVAWFAIVLTGRYPNGLYEFVAKYTRFITRTSAYVALMTDEYPSFWGNPDDAYPVRMHFAGPLPKYNRLKTFFRAILGIPIFVLRYVMQLLLEIAAIGAWFVIVVTGKQPRGLHEALELGMSYTARSDAYIFLLTETYPPFQDRREVYGGPTPAGEPPSAPPLGETGGSPVHERPQP